MADGAKVFLSYAREDMVVVRALHANLLARGHEVWVDWEDIQASVEWRREIEDAVASVETMVFVLSPHSVAGNSVCHQELELADRFRKRLVPVVVREVEDGVAPDLVARWNWIFLRPEDDFAAACDTLHRALITDLRRLRSHTRLLRRARDWQGNRRRSALLRGDDLREMEQEFADPAAEPPLVPPQPSYLLASRQNERREQRQRLVAVSVALVVALVLAGLALWQSHLRERQRQRAVVRQLAAEAELERDSRDGGVERSVWMAAEALQRSLDLGEPSVAAERSLRRGLALMPVLRAAYAVPRLRPSQLGAAGGLAYAPDGSSLVSTGHRRLSVIDVAGQQAEVLELEGQPATVAVASGGRLVAVAEEGAASVLLYDRPGVGPSASAPTRLETGVEATALAFDHAGRRLAVGGEKVVVVLSTLGAAPPLELPAPGWVRDVTFTDEDRGLVVESAERSRSGGGREFVRLVWESWRLSTDGARRDRPRELMVTEPAAARLFDFDLEGSTVVTGTTGPMARLEPSRVRLWRHAGDDFREVSTISLDRGVTALELSTDGERLAAAVADRTARVWDVSSGDEVARVDIGTTAGAVAFSPRDGDLAAAGVEVRIWDTAGGEPLDMRIEGRSRTVRTLTFDGDGRRFALTTASLAQVRRTEDGRPFGALRRRFPSLDSTVAPIGRPPRSPVFLGGDAGLLVAGRDVVRWTPGSEAVPLAGVGFGDGRHARQDFLLSEDGSVFVAAPEPGSFEVFHLDDGASIGRLPGRVAALSRRGDRLAIGGDEVAVLDTGDGRRLATLFAGSRVRSLAFSPDGRRLAAALRDGQSQEQCCVHDLDRHAETTDAGVCLPLEKGVTSIGFDPQGTHLVTVVRQGPASVWRLETQQPVLRVEGQVRAVRFSADGRLLAVSVSGRGVLVYERWSSESPRLQSNLRHVEDVRSLAFSPDAAYLLTGGNDARVRRWTVSQSRLLERACQRLGEPLPEATWLRLVGADEERHVCRHEAADR